MQLRRTATPSTPSLPRDTAITEPSRRAPALGLLALALAAAVFGLTRTWGKPFEHGWLGHNGARYAHIARNYERDGFLLFLGAPRMDVAARERGGGESAHSTSAAAPFGDPYADPDTQPAVYAHHPAATSLVVGLAFRWWGVSEDVARLLPIVATLVVLLLLARLVALEAGAEAGALAALAAAATPMVSVYGAHLDVQGTPVLALSLAVVLGYRRFLAGGSAWPLLLAAAAGLAFDWYALYALASCVLHLYLTRRPMRAAALVLGAGVLLLFSAMLTWLAFLPGSSVAAVLGSAGVRGAGALAGADLAPRAAAWWMQTNALMPAWPALLVLALLIAAGLPRVTPPDADVRPVLGARGLLVLLLLPPLLHAALFPAGLLVHDYWLFGLPPALAAAFAFAARRLARPVALGAALLLFVPGWFGAQRVLAQHDELPSLVGKALAGATAPGDVIFTNFDCNPFVAGRGDAHLDKFPEVTFYSDRAVRGLVGVPAGTPDGTSLDAALARRSADWFLLTPWPPGAAEGLRNDLLERAAGPPQRLSESPPVELFRLRPPH